MILLTAYFNKILSYCKITNVEKSKCLFMVLILEVISTLNKIILGQKTFCFLSPISGSKLATEILPTFYSWRIHISALILSVNITLVPTHNFSFTKRLAVWEILIIQFISKSDVIPLGISDHNLIGCIRKINSQKYKRKIINTRNYHITKKKCCLICAELIGRFIIQAR